MPITVYFHGGGWVMGTLDSYDGLCRALANASASIVVSVDYRLAPEHPFPIPFQDCVSATIWTHDHARQFGGDPARIGVAGSSSGGNLAAAVALWSRDESGPHLSVQMLIYPALDSRMATASHRSMPEGLLLHRDQVEWYWSQYVPDIEMRSNAYASPCRADKLEGLASAIIVTAEYDPLCDEGEEYARRLMLAGVPVSAHRYGGHIHGFMMQLDSLTEARASVADLGARVRRAFSQPC